MQHGPATDIKAAKATVLVHLSFPQVSARTRIPSPIQVAQFEGELKRVTKEALTPFFAQEPSTAATTTFAPTRRSERFTECFTKRFTELFAASAAGTATAIAATTAATTTTSTAAIVGGGRRQTALAVPIVSPSE